MSIHEVTGIYTCSVYGSTVAQALKITLWLLNVLLKESVVMKNLTPYYMVLSLAEEESSLIRKRKYRDVSYSSELIPLVKLLLGI